MSARNSNRLEPLDWIAVELNGTGPGLRSKEKNSFGDCKHLGSTRPIIQGIVSLIAFFDAELGCISRSFIVDTGNRSWPSSLRLWSIAAGQLLFGWCKHSDGGEEMEIASLCRGPLVVASHNSTVQEAAELMRRYHVGAVVVIEVVNGMQVPLGIVTDRDIVVEVIAMKLAPADLTVTDIMSTELVAAREDDDIFEAIRIMRDRGVRRIPIVNAQRGLVGLVSLTDLLPLVAQEYADLAKLPLVGRKQECELRH